MCWGGLAVVKKASPGSGNYPFAYGQQRWTGSIESIQITALKSGDPGVRKVEFSGSERGNENYPCVSSKAGACPRS